MKGSVTCYRTAHSALHVANPSGEWKNQLKDLKNADVHGDLIQEEMCRMIIYHKWKGIIVVGTGG
jgi:hypothetical protein